MIYALEIINARFVKIGFTSNLDVSCRIEQLQTGSPFEIKKIFIVDGTILQEKEIHRALKTAFGRSNISVPPNEWYPGRCNIMKDFLPKLKRYGANQALAYLDQFNPSVNTKEHHDRSYEPKAEWPSLSKAKAEKMLSEVRGSW